jgi:hypothetical protein
MDVFHWHRVSSQCRSKYKYQHVSRRLSSQCRWKRWKPLGIKSGWEIPSINGGLGESPRKEGFSSKPCLIRGGYQTYPPCRQHRIFRTHPVEVWIKMTMLLLHSCRMPKQCKTSYLEGSSFLPDFQPERITPPVWSRIQAELQGSARDDNLKGWKTKKYRNTYTFTLCHPWVRHSKTMCKAVRHDMTLLCFSRVLGNEMMEGELQLALTWDPQGDVAQYS